MGVRRGFGFLGRVTAGLVVSALALPKESGTRGRWVPAGRATPEAWACASYLSSACRIVEDTEQPDGDERCSLHPGQPIATAVRWLDEP